MSNDIRATIRLATRGKSETVFLPQDVRDHGPLRKLLAKQPELFSFDEAKGSYTLVDRDAGFPPISKANLDKAVATVIRGMGGNLEPNAASDDEDWIPVKKQTASGFKHDLVVSIAAKENAKAGRASICFRGDAKNFLGDAAISVDIDVGRDDLNRLRIRAHRNSDGEFKLARPGRGAAGTPRAIFAIDLWPNQTRSQPAEYQIVHKGQVSYLIATLPKDWAKPLADIKTEPKLNSAGLPKVHASPTAKTSAGAQVLKAADAIKASHPNRGQPSVNMGEPPPGRSALDQKRAAQG